MHFFKSTYTLTFTVMNNELKRRFKVQELHEEIKIAAYELYEQRGMAHGYDLNDWLQAERMVIEKKTKKQQIKEKRR